MKNCAYFLKVIGALLFLVWLGTGQLALLVVAYFLTVGAFWILHSVVKEEENEKPNP